MQTRTIADKHGRPIPFTIGANVSYYGWNGSGVFGGTITGFDDDPYGQGDGVVYRRPDGGMAQFTPSRCDGIMVHA